MSILVQILLMALGPVIEYIIKKIMERIFKLPKTEANTALAQVKAAHDEFKKSRNRQRFIDRLHNILSNLREA